MSVETGSNGAGPTKRILVVGGGSRAAVAFRSYAATVPEFHVTTLVRRPIPSFEAETIIQVADYFAPPEEPTASSDVAINFVGVTQGRDKKLLQEINVAGSIRLANAARRLGVAHFVQLSSLHVYGYASIIGQTTRASPQTPYAWSKLVSDDAVLRLATTQFTVSIFRLPILYGIGVGANLSKLASLMVTLPMFPVSVARPPRSVLHISNFVALLEALVRNPVGGIQLGCDAKSLTLDFLAEVIGEKTGKQPRLLHLPEWAFTPLKLLSKSLYSRLYTRNTVLQQDCIKPIRPLPMPVRVGLRDIVRI